MAYPKPLSQKNIDKLFDGWDERTVATLHKYFEAFANLYGSIQLKDAWKVFKLFEPKIHKKQFIEFSSIARRENVPYYVFEIDEIYSDERRIDTERFIVHKSLVSTGYGKMLRVYELQEMQLNKPYYAKNDLLSVAENRFNDAEIRNFIDNMQFTVDKHEGKLFTEAVFLTYDEQFDLDYYKSQAVKDKILAQASRPFSEKLMERLKNAVEFSFNPISFVADFLKDNDFVFESQKQIEEFFTLFQDFLSNSHLWRNCGFTPKELSAMRPQGIPKEIILGPGIQKAIREGQLDRDEIIERFREMGVEVVE